MHSLFCSRYFFLSRCFSSFFCVDIGKRIVTKIDKTHIPIHIYIYYYFWFFLIDRKATRQTVDMWLVSHATPTSSSSSCVELSSPTHVAAGNSSSGRGGGSGATTPVRKISAHEFERGGLLKPIVNTIDGTPTFLSVSTGDAGQPGGPQVGSSNSNRPQRRSRHELRHLDEKDLIFELVGFSTRYTDISKSL